MKLHAVAWDGAERYLVAFTRTVTALSPVRLVDLRTGRVYTPLQVGSITAQAEPDEWRFEIGPKADRALEVAAASAR